MSALRRTFVAVTALLVLVPADSAAEWSTAVDHNGLLHSLSLDERAYWLGDTVHVSYSVTNTTDETIFLEFGCGYQALFTEAYDSLDERMWLDPASCVGEVGYDFFQPGEVYTKVTQWDLRRFNTPWYVDAPATYTVVGELHTLMPEHANTVSLDIEVGDASMTIPELDAGTWGRIKSLYR